MNRIMPLAIAVLFVGLILGCGSSNSSSDLPANLVKGAKIYFFVTNDNPFQSGHYSEVAVVEQISGQWVLLSNTYTYDDGKKEQIRRWVNFNNVVWYQIRK
jgi:hypothetical protein